MIGSLVRNRFAALPVSTQAALRFYCQPSTSQSTKSNVVEVCTTGYSFTKSSGRVGKYGIFWGHNDPRNSICEVPGITNVAAMLMAMIDAVRVARKDDSLEKMVIYTDFNCPPGFHSKLKTYAMRDFHSYLGPKMKNAELLKDLYESTKDMNVVFKHRPAVEDKKPNYVIANILEGENYASKSRPPDSPPIEIHCGYGDEMEASGETPTTSSEGWPHVYTTALYKSSKNGFKSASYAVVWPEKRHGNDTMHRLALVPVTQFRAQLSAIEEALKQAVENRLPQVVVVTDSQAFMTNWRKGWTKPSGTFAPNKFLYNRIRDLTQEGIEVRFRYETPQKDSPVWSLALDKCLEAIDLPVVGKDRSEYNRELKEILLTETDSLESSDVHRVRIFKRSPNFTSKIVWEGEDAEYSDKHNEEERKTHHALFAVLEKASASGMRQLIIRTDSPRLILSAENWLPVWHRTGWRNSLHKPIADADVWKKIWSLKKTVKVYWELMDPMDDNDKAAAQLNVVSISNKV
ncbi:unnamed protein product [Haemonchus placei]|uniref:ribonuclease H n=1 Tax=Haemonchus placei TaxID=6290 RepID=A0A0N4WQP4_HAEPC|nr:unnamed protein product [Haemonchus placei]